MELEALFNTLSFVVDKPIFRTLLTLFVGGYLLKTISDSRAKKDKIREKAIEFLEETGSDINSVFSMIYGCLRSNNLTIVVNSELYKKRGELFTKRFLVRIRSKAYFKKDIFWKQYDDIVWELHHIVNFMVENTSRDYETDDIVNLIESNIARFKKDYPFHNDRKPNNKFNSPVKELFIWTEMVWDRANYLIANYLENSLK